MEVVICAVTSVCALLALAWLYRRCCVSGVSCTCTERVDGCVIIVTGASSGIGLQVARQLALRGGRVYLACRSLQAARDCCRDVIDQTANTSVYPVQLDLNRFASVRQFVHRFRQVESRLDILVNNAGCFYCPSTLTEDGFTVTFQTNYLGPFLLTRLLQPLLTASASARVLFISSAAHLSAQHLSFDCAGRTVSRSPRDRTVSTTASPFQFHFTAYSQSKLALTAFAVELARRLKGTNVSVNSVDPGNVNTAIYRHYTELNRPHNKLFRRYFMRSCAEGAETVVHCAVSSKVDGITSHYFRDCAVVDCNPLARTRELGVELWTVSDRWTGVTSL